MKKMFLPLASVISAVMISTPVSAQVVITNPGSSISQVASVGQQKIQRVQELVRAAGDHGLFYSLYLSTAVEAELQSLAASSDLTLDMKLTSIVNRLVSDLNRGRVLPTSMQDKVSIKPKVISAALVSAANSYISGSMSSAQLISMAVPQNRIYAEAQYLLKGLLDLKSQGTWAVKPANLVIATVSKKTTNAALISYTRRRLANFGYANNLASKVYDTDLYNAISAFQKDNGLGVDGVAGVAQTWKLLDKNIDQLITQATLNLDRTRWLPDQNSNEYIYVNLARQTFQYFENEQETLAFKTINGRLDRQTTIMVDESRLVVLNPTWTVPRNIFVKDKIPLLQADPTYITSHHMKMYSDLTGAEVDPTTIDWTLNPAQLPYTVVQNPGGMWNALGYIKFPLTNGFAIYMHDTNERSLFAETDRLRSSGCMRLEKPFDLGVKLLAGTNKKDGTAYTKEDLLALTEGLAIPAEKPTEIGLKRGVKVYVSYKTISQSVDGKLIASNDPYGVDALMYQVMTSGK